ncbi:MAG: hypothetical protein KAQ68_07065 [Clostridiales bacterium]|nr:hypothetical protein [Clostridiales bacterium]
MKYLYETHAHTAEASPCACVCAEDMIEAYHRKGYHGVIITDHVGEWGLGHVRGSWSDKVDQLVLAYEKAREAGDLLGVAVLFAMEIALNCPYRDYLVYGFKPSTLYQYENIQSLHIDELYNVTQHENALLFAAHPFRGMRKMPDSCYLDGVEVYNGNPRQVNNNEMARQWAAENDLLRLSGSDYHHKGDISGGVNLPSCPETIADFVKIIKNKNYTLKVK